MSSSRTKPHFFVKKNPSPNKNNNNAVSATFPTLKDKKKGEGFTSRDYKFLTNNENYRYLPNSKTVGHAVIINNEKGEKVAWQFNIPDQESDVKVVPLTNFQCITRFGMTRYIAETKGKIPTPMYAKRFVQAKINVNNQENDLDIACFSSDENGKEPFWGSGDQQIPLFRDNLSTNQKKELKKEIKELKSKAKGGKDLVLDAESVWFRDANKKRNPDQNRVMGESAVEAYKSFLATWEDELSPKMKQILEQSINAPLRNLFKSQRRPEWLHGYGFSLTPMSKDPQQRNNLGAAPKWANTEMMVLERIAKWFALNLPEAYVAIKPHFEMLLDSELIKNIHFEVTIKDKDNWIKFLQDINPFKEYPLYRKPSDLAQATAIAYHILKGVKPVSEERISNITQGNTISNNNAEPMKDQSLPVEKNQKNKTNYPTYLQCEKSIVQVSTTSFEPNYDEPWLGSHIVGSSGTGLVIERNGKKFVVTNGHCIENAITVSVRLTNDRKKKYKADIKNVSYQCDLALLEVNDPEFQMIAEPVEFGEMAELRDKVQTIGFPMGGNEISISRGIVSRIEVRDYVMSGLNMLQVQIDAAVNPGNSGGPVFFKDKKGKKDKVAGVAFQGYDRQGLGYMIPVPVIEHFLNESFSDKPYRGFPVLPISIQTLENAYLRKFYGLSEHQTGVRITKVDYLSDAFSKVKPNDILLEIDSHSISNEGTVDIHNVGNCIDFVHLTHMKYIGDTVNLKVLRKNAETNQSEIHNINVILDCVPLETEKVPQTEHDKMPTYFIAAGIVFTPLTRNYVEGDGAELEDVYLMEEGCSLIDAPKKAPDEQIIVVNEILACEETEGYESFKNCIVTSINGKAIKNIYDVIEAIENHQDEVHEITTGKQNTIVVKNMSKNELADVLKKHHIHSDRSEDLLIAQQPVHRNENNNVKQIKISKPVKSGMEEGVETETEKDEQNVITAIKQKHGHLTPGLKRFSNVIDHLEDKYKDFVESDDDSFNDEMQQSYSSEEMEEVSDDAKDISLSSSESENGKEEISEEDPLKKRLTKVSNRHRLFQQKRPIQSDSDDMEFIAKKRKIR